MPRNYSTLGDWKPKTQLGRDVFEGKITSIDEIFLAGKKIKEPEIVDKLLPDLRNDIILIGGSPGKGGGVRRTPTKRTARMHRSGRRYRISALIVLGVSGYLGIGKGTAQDHRTAIEKATQEAKLNIIPIKLGCGSWECACGGTHSVPFEISGKSGSVRVILKPAPKGLGLCIPNEAKKVLDIAGVRDIWSKDYGHSRTRINYIMAIYNAFKKMNLMKLGNEKHEVKQEKPEEEAVA